MKKLDLIVFDLDGTLVDSNEAISLCFNLALQEMGHAVRPIHEVAKLIGLPLHDMFAEFIQRNDVDEAVARYRAHYQTICIEKTKLFPDTRNLLDYLRSSKIKMAVATNKPLGFTRNILESTGIAEYFGMIAGPDNVEFPKPHPAMLQLVMDTMMTDNTQTAYVGDSITDCLTAKQAGVTMLAVATGAHTQQELRQVSPEWIGYSLANLLSYLISKKEGLEWQ